MIDELERARLYLVSRARLAAGPVEELLPELVAAGVDVYQLREKEMEARELIAHAEPIAQACRAAGIPFVLNDRPDLAVLVGAAGVHLGQDDVPPAEARRIVGELLIGGSTHDRQQVDSAIEDGWDYFAVGPVYETPTKPGRPAVGLDLLTYAAERVASVPWFAIGGIDRPHLPEVLAAGARRVVVVRAIADADDPVAATEELRREIDAVPL